MNGEEEEEEGGYLGLGHLRFHSPARFWLELSFILSELELPLSVSDAPCPQQEPTSKHNDNV